MRSDFRVHVLKLNLEMFVFTPSTLLFLVFLVNALPIYDILSSQNSKESLHVEGDFFFKMVIQYNLPGYGDKHPIGVKGFPNP
jgi:hypothetical protein